MRFHLLSSAGTLALLCSMSADNPEAGANGSALPNTGAGAADPNAQPETAADGAQGAQQAQETAGAPKDATETADASQAPAPADVAPKPGDLVDGHFLDEDLKPIPLRTDGPTLKEWTDRGYAANAYPPAGYAVVTEEERAMVDAHDEADDAEDGDAPRDRRDPYQRLADLERRMAALEARTKHFV